MKGKVLFVTGLAVGYVLGTRAGRKRYEQIKGAAQKVWETPALQAQVHKAQDFAAEKLGEVPGVLADGAAKLASSIVSSRKSKPVATSPSATSAAPSGSAAAANAEPAESDES